VQCRGSSGEQKVEGAGRLELEVGLPGDKYQFTVHCPPPKGRLTRYGVENAEQQNDGSLMAVGHSYKRNGGWTVRGSKEVHTQGCLFGTTDEMTWELCDRGEGPLEPARERPFSP